ncbi:MAG: type VI secretion system baseplate subunit TssG [Acidobacteria bacterium]|nr:type VI secretion system baseplate subunit TssG [Acidobacteriota bacterium]
MGRFHPPGREAVRLRGSARLSHAASDIESVAHPVDAAPVLQTRGFGLTGESGELPHAYSSYVLERTQRGDTAMAAFLDIFHHRMLSFLYRAWQSPRFALAAEAGEPNPMDGFLWSLLGLSAAPPPDEIVGSLLASVALLLPRPRSAEALRGMLSEYFSATVRIEEFRGNWSPFANEDRTVLDDEPAAGRPCFQLGMGAALGDQAWDPQAAIRIRVGPLPLRQYREFLPGGPAWSTLRTMVQFFSNGAFDFEINPVLAREEAPRIRLGGGEPLQLGWTTWLAARPLRRDPDDTVLRG